MQINAAFKQYLNLLHIHGLFLVTQLGSTMQEILHKYWEKALKV